MKMYDLNTQEELDGNGKIKQATPGKILELNSKDIPELADFVVGDEIELHLVTKVKETGASIEKEAPMPMGKDGKTEKENVVDTGKCKLEILSVGVENITPDRKKANDRGLDKETSKEIDTKRGQGRE